MKNDPEEGDNLGLRSGRFGLGQPGMSGAASVIRPRIKRRDQTAVSAELAKGYASLEASKSRIYPSLDAIYADVVPKGLRRVSINEHYPLFRTKFEHTYVLSPEAVRDLRGVRLAVSRSEERENGEITVRAVIRDIGWLADMPSLGAPRPDLVGLPYNFPVKYSIYFHPIQAPKGIKVVRILDSGPYMNVAQGESDYFAPKAVSPQG